MENELQSKEELLNLSFYLSQSPSIVQNDFE